ncbi:hypothetical protein [Streptomyces genisteinicus]|uniref:hypothetical protein n=1 Tax=Streptomyces genisteinicus TaxID=2768068 RepID=UPI001FE2B5BC|nr:hypothetical protein [Streptomyces genisteinicus]
MVIGMNTETCDPAELAVLREILASRAGAAQPASWEAVRSFEAEHVIVLPEPYARAWPMPGTACGPGMARARAYQRVQAAVGQMNAGP